VDRITKRAATECGPRLHDRVLRDLLAVGAHPPCCTPPPISRTSPRNRHPRLPRWCAARRPSPSLAVVGPTLTRVSVRSEGAVADCTNAYFTLQRRALPSVDEGPEESTARSWHESCSHRHGHPHHLDPPLRGLRVECLEPRANGPVPGFGCDPYCIVPVVRGSGR
jgi:hypothetical protein